MAVRAERAAPGSASTQHTRSVREWASRRLVSLDNLKVILIAWIIAIHAILGYAGSIDVWSYTSVREVTLSPVLETVLLLLFTPFGYVVIPLLFLLAGLLAPPSMERKGPRRFARDRLIRLGLPFGAYVLLVQPAVMYALEHPLGAATRSYWYEFLGEERQIDTGPLWFVGVLLLFSLGYAGWVAVRPSRNRGGTGPLTARQLVVLAGVVAPLSFLVRLVYPYGSESGVTDLNLWEWPACGALFGLGIVAAGRGWLAAVPDRLSRQCRSVTLLAVAAMVVLLSTVGLLDRVDDAMGGWLWPAFAFPVIETTLAVFGPVWLLGVAQRHLDRPLRWAGPAVGRSAYGAFILQTPVLIGLAVAVRPVPMPAEAKAVVVAAAGIGVAFALAWLLISRIPALARVL
jgi:hypothetical protein